MIILLTPGTSSNQSDNKPSYLSFGCVKAKTGTLLDFLMLLICLCLSSAPPGYFFANFASASSGPTFFTLYFLESLPKQACIYDIPPPTLSG